MQTWSIRPWRPDDGTSCLYQLWIDTVGDLWPLTADTFASTCQSSGAGGHLAFDGDNLVGAVYTKWRGDQGQIVYLLVTPRCQRQGIGSSLLAAAVSGLEKQGVSDIHLGSGAGSYFWPGIPQKLPAARPFFEFHGWTVYEESVDMILPLKSFDGAPAYIGERLPADVELQLATLAQAQELIRFVEEAFPSWMAYYQDMVDNGWMDRVLVASQQEDIVGAALVEPGGCMWDSLFDGPVGTVGAVGVKEAARDQGIGLAMSARATEILKQNGSEFAYLGWTWLVDWYGRIGYEVWRTYDMAKKTIR